MLVAVIVVIALVCLIVGFVLSNIVLAWVALALSVVGLAVLVLTMYAARRKDRPTGTAEAMEADEERDTPEPETAPSSDTETEQDSPEGKQTIADSGSASTAKDTERQDTEGEPGDTGAAPQTSDAHVRAGSGDDLLVYVIPGRRRYHSKDCRLLVDRDSESLTAVEAQEEGFTACTVCDS